MDSAFADKQSLENRFLPISRPALLKCFLALSLRAKANRRSSLDSPRTEESTSLQDGPVKTKYSLKTVSFECQLYSLIPLLFIRTASPALRGRSIFFATIRKLSSYTSSLRSKRCRFTVVLADSSSASKMSLICPHYRENRRVSC